MTETFEPEEQRKWSLMQKNWFAMIDQPNNYASTRLFFDDIRDLSSSIPAGLPDGMTLSDMPYIFWRHILVYSFNPGTLRYVLVNLPKERIEQYLLFLKTVKENGDDATVQEHLAFISMRSDAYGGIPVEWLADMYIND